MNKNTIIGFGLALAVVAGIIFFVNQKPQPNQTQNTNEQKILAGRASPYLVFNKTDYNKALTSGKIIFLDFYANWCPICRAEGPELRSGFDSLQTDKVIGFRVNYNDSDTDSDEKSLASQFGIVYQHTKVILKNGQVVLKSGESWTKEKFAEEINKLL